MNGNRKKVLASIAALCGAVEIAATIIGGYQIKHVNDIDRNMSKIISDTKDSTLYQEHVVSKRESIDLAYSSGAITKKEYDKKITDLISEQYLLDKKEDLMTPESLQSYTNLHNEYVARGSVVAGCIIGGVSTGSVAIAALTKFLEERYKKENTQEFECMGK